MAGREASNADTEEHRRLMASKLKLDGYSRRAPRRQ
jgi:hypothetical protein